MSLAVVWSTTENTCSQYSTLKRMEESFSEGSPNHGDDELSPMERPHQAHQWPDGKPSWDSLLNAVLDRQRRRQHRPYPTPGYLEFFGTLPMSSAIMAN